MKTYASILLISIWIYFVICTNGFSFPKRKIPLENHMSTKTPYRFIENPDITEVQYENCKPAKIWGIIRHGTRSPGRETKVVIEGRLIELRDMILKADQNNERAELNPLREWTMYDDVDGRKTLTHEGEDELINLAERFMKRFPTILPEQWDNSSFLFRHTDASRTRASARSFTTGLFGRRVSNHVYIPAPTSPDPILRFYKACDKWRINIKENPDTLYEVKKYLEGSLVLEVVKNVTKRWNLPPGSLDIKDVRLLYSSCAFETAWEKHKKSPWCNLLTVDDAKVLEYAEDLEYYWIDGYGFDLTTKIPCVLFQDLITHMRGENKQKAIFYFSHSGSVLKFLANLGLFREKEHLLHDGFYKNQNRFWRTSYIDVFSSNVVFVRFECTDGPKILSLFQERPVTLPGCPTDSDLCPLADIEKTYKNNISSCDFYNMCSIKPFYQQWISKVLNWFN